MRAILQTLSLAGLALAISTLSSTAHSIPTVEPIPSLAHASTALSIASKPSTSRNRESTTACALLKPGLGRSRRPT